VSRLESSFRYYPTPCWDRSHAIEYCSPNPRWYAFGHPEKRGSRNLPSVVQPNPREPDFYSGYLNRSGLIWFNSLQRAASGSVYQFCFFIGRWGLLWWRFEPLILLASRPFSSPGHFSKNLDAAR